MSSSSFKYNHLTPWGQKCWFYLALRKESSLLIFSLYSSGLWWGKPHISPLAQGCHYTKGSMDSALCCWVLLTITNCFLAHYWARNRREDRQIGHNQ